MKNILLFIVLAFALASCGEKKNAEATDEDKMQGTWSCVGEKAKVFSSMQIKGDQMILEFSREGSKPDLSTFTLFEKGDKKWISIVERKKDPIILEYLLDDKNLKLLKPDGSLRIEFQR